MMNIEQEDIKHDLIRYLQKAVRELQKEYVSNRDVIPSSELTNSLCYGLEAVFLHGLIGATPEKISSINFWIILNKHTHKSTLSDVESSSQIKTDIGRCRVWIRLALNGIELESYFRLILADTNTLRQYYETWAIIRDVECMDLLLTSIQGLECVRFHLGHNSTVLNDWSNISLSLAGHAVQSHQSNVPSLLPTETNSFDDYELSPDDREEVRLMFRFDNTHICDQTNEIEDQIKQANEDQSNQPNASNESYHLQNMKPPSGHDENSLLTHSERSGHSSTLVMENSDFGDSHVRGENTTNKDRMTDEMRDLRFEQIVKENLEKFPLDYDRIKANQQSEMQNNRSPVDFAYPRDVICLSPLLEDECTVTEPDSFWRGMQDEQWSEAENHSNGVKADENASILGNSLRRDTWVGPPLMLDFAPAPPFAANLNHQIRNELEASYGTILADYQRTVPQQSKLLTKGPSCTFSDHGDNSKTKNGCTGSIKPSQVQRSTGLEIEGGWVLIDDDDCPFNAEPYHVDSSFEHLLPFVMQRFKEKSVDEQDYACRGCSREMEGKKRRCYFDGYWYCCDCHQNNTFLIPSRIVYNWDYKKLRVSAENHKFLKTMYDWPLLNIQELNPELYEISDELNHVRGLRKQCYYLAGYMFHCSSSYAMKYWRVMNDRLYYFSHIDNYSVRDLVNVHSGSFGKALQKINESAVKLIYSCTACQSRGFYCEICQASDVIYPFEKTTVVCEKCKNTYHESCQPMQELGCPKCIRIQVRKMSSPLDPIDLVSFSHPSDVASLHL